MSSAAFGASAKAKSLGLRGSFVSLELGLVAHYIQAADKRPGARLRDVEFRV